MIVRVKARRGCLSV